MFLRIVGKVGGGLSDGWGSWRFGFGWGWGIFCGRVQMGGLVMMILVSCKMCIISYVFMLKILVINYT